MSRYKEALAYFQAVEDWANEMRIANLLGSAECDLGHYDAARAWYAEAERLARERDDQSQLGATAQNLGILLQRHALKLPQDAQVERGRLLGDAAASVVTSLATKRKLGDEVGAASSLHQLGVIHRHLGNVDEAERHSQEALAISERLELPNVYKVYSNLEDIAIARKRPEEAAVWRAKKETKIAQLQRLAEGNLAPLPPSARADDACPCGSGLAFSACHGADPKA